MRIVKIIFCCPALTLKFIGIQIIYTKEAQKPVIEPNLVMVITRYLIAETMNDSSGFH